MGWIADLLKEIPSAARYKAELEEMEKENVALKQKVSTLETTVENLRQEVQRRDEIIQKYETHDNLLDDSKVNILKHLFKYDNQQIQHIAQALKLEVQLAQYHVEELLKVRKVKYNTIYRKEVHEGFVGTTTRQIPVPVLNIDQEGRKYLIENGMV